MTESLKLLEDLALFAKQNFMGDQDKVDCFPKYYRHKKGDPQQLQKIYQGIYAGVNIQSLEDFQDLSTVLAYIKQIDPEFYGDLSQIRKEYFQKGYACINHSAYESRVERYSILLGRLMNSQELASLVNSFMYKLNEIDSQPQIIINLRLLQQKIRWQMDKKQYFLIKQLKVVKFVQTVQNSLRSFGPLKNSLFAQFKGKVLIAFMQYLLVSFKTIAKERYLEQRLQQTKKPLIDQVKRCQKDGSNFMEQSQQMVCQLVLYALQLYGVFDQKYISEFIINYTNYIYNPTYLKVIMTFVDKTDHQIMKEKAFFKKMLVRILEAIPKVNRGSLEANYETIKQMSDLVIEICRKVSIDCTKQIKIRLSSVKNEIKAIFLSTFLLVSQSKKLQGIKSQLSCSAQRQMNLKQYELYDEFIRLYGSTIAGIGEELLSNPQRREEFLWQLLIIRNSIMTNIHELLQKYDISKLFQNILNAMLCNIFSQECAEILIQIIRSTTTPQNCITNLSFCQIIRDNANIVMPTTNTLQSLQKVFEELVRYDINEVQNMKLFLLSLQMFIHLLKQQKGYNNPTFYSVSSSILQLVWPQDPQLNEAVLLQCKQAILTLVGGNFSERYAQIYLQMMCLSDFQLVEGQSPLIKIHQYYIPYSKITQSQVQRHDLFHLVKGASFDSTILKHCLEQMPKQLTFHETQVCFLMLEAFEHFRKQVCSKQTDNPTITEQIYLREQFFKMKDIVINVVQLISKENFLKDVIQLLKAMQVFSVYLLSIMIDYDHYGSQEEFSGFVSSMMTALNNMKKIKWYVTYRIQDNNNLLGQLWGNSYSNLQTLYVRTKRKAQGSNSSPKQSQEIFNLFNTNLETIYPLRGEQDKMNPQHRLLLGETVESLYNIDLFEE